ncbi:hypothetical protein P7C73_g6677, partial [Tremellales sp. Uapishka_1]
MFSPRTMYLADKENDGSSSPSSSAGKARISGIGKSPRRARPYPRATSIQRAKEHSANMKKRVVEKKEMTKKKVVAAPLRRVNIPLRLPKPSFPPVPPLIMNGEVIPTQYVVDHLTRTRRLGSVSYT